VTSAAFCYFRPLQREHFMGWINDCRALDRRVFSLAGARLVVTAGYSMVMPFLAMHIAVDRKEPVVIVGAIWLVAGGLGAVAQWLAGELSDRLGRRPLMLAAMWLRAVNLVAMGLAISSHAPLLVIAALTVANAVLRGFFDPVAAAMVADLAPAEQRLAAFSLQRVGVNIGWAAGPAVAWLAAGVPYATLFYISAPLTLLAAATLARIPAPPRGSSGQRAFTLGELLTFTSDRHLLIFLLATVCFFVLQVQLYQTVSIYGAQSLHLGRAEIGHIYTLNGVLVVLLQLPALRAIERLGRQRAIIAGALGYGLAYGAMGLVHSQLGLYACITAVTLSEIVASPAQQAAITALAPPGRVGAYTGLFGLCQVIGQSTGPLIGTTLLAVLPPRGAWFVLAVFGGLAAIGYGRLVFPPQTPRNPLASGPKA
jgi:MFS family permease